MKASRHVFTIFIIIFCSLWNNYCSSNPQLVQIAPLKDRFKTYTKYLRSQDTKIPTPKTKPRTIPNHKTLDHKISSGNTRLHRSNFGRIKSLTLDHFQNLHQIFLENLQTFRYWIQFLKLRPELGLKEFKIRTQQLRNSILHGLETSVKSRQSLLAIKELMLEISKDLQSNSIQFMETPLFSPLVTSKSRMEFLLETLSFYVNHIATLQIFQFELLVKNLDELIAQTEALNSKNWTESFKSIALKNQGELVFEIKTLTRQQLEKFKQIKQNYVYAESQILTGEDRIQSKKLPSNRQATRTEQIAYKKLQVSLNQKIDQFMESQSLQLNLLKHQAQLHKKWLENNPTKTGYPDIPLANKLFIGNNIESNLLPMSEKSSFKLTTKLPDWI